MFSYFTDGSKLLQSLWNHLGSIYKNLKKKCTFYTFGLSTGKPIDIIALRYRQRMFIAVLFILQQTKQETKLMDIKRVMLNS